MLAFTLCSQAIEYFSSLAETYVYNQEQGRDRRRGFTVTQSVILFFFFNKHFILQPPSVVPQRSTSSIKVDGSWFVLSGFVPQRKSIVLTMFVRVSQLKILQQSLFSFRELCWYPFWNLLLSQFGRWLFLNEEFCHEFQILLFFGEDASY